MKNETKDWKQITTGALVKMPTNRHLDKNHPCHWCNEFLVTVVVKARYLDGRYQDVRSCGRTACIEKFQASLDARLPYVTEQVWAKRKLFSYLAPKTEDATVYYTDQGHAGYGIQLFNVFMIDEKPSEVQAATFFPDGTSKTRKIPCKLFHGLNELVTTAYPGYWNAKHQGFIDVGYEGHLNHLMQKLAVEYEVVINLVLYR